MIEDYLTLFENLISLAGGIDIKNNIIKATTVVFFADSPYTPLATDEEIFLDTTDGAIDVLLPTGIDGTNYRMQNIGEVKNDVNLIPFSGEKLFGQTENEKIYDSESLIMTFEKDKGWW